MRVLVIARSLSRTSVGGDIYVRGLIHALSSTSAELVIAAPPVVAERIAVWAPQAQILPVPSSRGAVRIIRDLVGVHRWARQVNPDWIIYPHEFAPFTTYKTAIVLQNIAAFSDFARAEMGLRGALLRTMSRMRIRASDVVITPSMTAADIFRSAVGELPPTEQVLPCLQLSARPEARPPVTARQGTVLVVLGPWSYKNPDVIRQATLLLHRRDPFVAQHLKLRVAGTVDANIESAKNLGVLEREVLLDEMARAALVVFPSLVESLGLPALEAAALGARPAVMAGSAMSELLKGSATTFEDASALAELFWEVAQGAVYDVPPQDAEQLRRSLSAKVVGNHWIETLVRCGE